MMDTAEALRQARLLRTHLETAAQALGRVTGSPPDRATLDAARRSLVDAAALSTWLEGVLALPPDEPEPGPEPEPEPPDIEFPPSDDDVRPPARGQVIPVRAGINLQSAIETLAPARPFILELEPDVDYGHIELPALRGEGFATIRTRGRDDTLARPISASGLARIRSTIPGVPPILARQGAGYWALDAIGVTQSVGQTWDLIQYGHGELERSWDDVPHHFWLSRSLLWVPDDVQVRRGLHLNASDVVLRNTTVLNVKEEGFEAQALAGRFGRHYDIAGCLLESAGINVLFGGERTPFDTGPVQHVSLRSSLLYKRPLWRAPGTRWGVKNLLELKNAVDVQVVGVVMDGTWTAGQTGFAILLTVRNQYGDAPWSAVRDVHFRELIVRNAEGGVQMITQDHTHPEAPSTRSANFTFRNAYFDVSRRIMEGEPVDGTVIEDVVGLSHDAAFYWRHDTGPARDTVMRRVRYLNGEYGFWCEEHPRAELFPGQVWEDVTIGSDGPPKRGAHGPSEVIPVAEFLRRYSNPPF